MAAADSLRLAKQFPISFSALSLPQTPPIVPKGAKATYLSPLLDGAKSSSSKSLSPPSSSSSIPRSTSLTSSSPSESDAASLSFSFVPSAAASSSSVARGEKLNQTGETKSRAYSNNTGIKRQWVYRIQSFATIPPSI